MSMPGGTESRSAVPHYTWGQNYHIDGTGSTTYLEEALIPSLDQLRPGAQVADFGSGNGRLREKAPKPPDRHYMFRAFDREPTAVAAYNGAVAAHNRDHMIRMYDRAEVADLTQLNDLGQDRFDAAFLWRVLHSIPPRLPGQYGEEDVHVRILGQTGQTLKPDALYHVAVRSERDWVAGELRRQGVYIPGQVNNCYEPMREALAGLPDVQDWNLYFFREGELAEKARRAGLEVVYELAIEEKSGFSELKSRRRLSYDYVVCYKLQKNS